MSAANAVLKRLTPPLEGPQIESSRQYGKRKWYERRSAKVDKAGPSTQNIGVYFDAHMAPQLEEWREGTAWNEVRFLLAALRGKVLDIACGTGKLIKMNSAFHNLEMYGNDISQFLIEKPIERGLPKGRLAVCDATNMMQYSDGCFDFAYSIGSLEHFTERGISEAMRECKRIVRQTAFHFVPVTRDGKDRGWVVTYQSFHSNSVDWWKAKCLGAYDTVYALDSSWSFGSLIGKWLVCVSN